MDPTTKDIIDSVNSFYQNSFNQLVICTIGLVAFIGAFIPAVITFFQNKTLRLENDKLRSELRSFLSEEVSKQRVDIDKYIVERIAEAKKGLEADLQKNTKEISRLAAKTEASSFHTQAMLFMKEGTYHICLKNSLISAIAHIRSGDELNMQNVNNGITTSLTHLSKEEIEEDSEVAAIFKEYLEKIETINQNGRYQNLITSLKKSMDGAMKRTKK